MTEIDADQLIGEVIVEVPQFDITVEVPIPQVTVDIPAYNVVISGGGPPGPPGPPGMAGPPGTGNPVVGEAPSGVKNGVNTNFDTAQPYRTGTTAVYRNGLRETRGVGYTETGASQITFSVAPQAADDLSVDYIVQ
jgi:hypothetical protein